MEHFCGDEDSLEAIEVYDEGEDKACTRADDDFETDLGFEESFNDGINEFEATDVNTWDALEEGETTRSIPRTPMTFSDHDSYRQRRSHTAFRR